MPTSPRPLTDPERAGRALAHPLVLLMPDHTVAVLAGIATGDTATAEQRRLLQQVLVAIDAAEVAISRRTA